MVKYLVLDVDGTLTDGIVYIGNSGELCKGFSVRDGLGIRKIMERGIIPIILTSRESEIVVNRCIELGITEIYQGIKNKKDCLKKIIEDYKIILEELAYMADDINDLEAMQLAFVKACPKDAVFEIKSICNFISHYNGGHGAVREFCEYLLNADNFENNP